MVLGKAALPLLAGAASLALRAGWKLLQQRLENAVTQPAPSLRAVTKPAATPPTIRQATGAARPRRTIHIRSSWAVGDAHGNWRQGSSEHTIEIDD